jgi:hypothetical protein
VAQDDEKAAFPFSVAIKKYLQVCAGCEPEFLVTLMICVNPDPDFVNPLSFA